MTKFRVTLIADCNTSNADIDILKAALALQIEARLNEPPRGQDSHVDIKKVDVTEVTKTWTRKAKT